jgi:hypothetical protein
MLSHSIFVRSILILFSHTRVRIASVLCLSGLPTKALYTSLFSYVLRIQPIPSYLANPNNIREEYKLLSYLLSIYSSLFCHFLRAEREAVTQNTPPMAHWKVSRHRACCSDIHVYWKLRPQRDIRLQLYINACISRRGTTVFSWILAVM